MFDHVPCRLTEHKRPTPFFRSISRYINIGDSTQAWGLENTWEGYEKGGFEIRKLKANAAIALHMLSTGNNDLEWLRNE